MKRVELVSSRLRERYEKITHPSGLTVYVFPKKMTGIYALFATGFGSIDQSFSLKEGGDLITMPGGIAHFLEHKLFENEDGSDAFARFSELGADANAYTSYNKTAYLFSCTENFEQSLEELLRFVSHPHFTPSSVKREIGIISEEIRMTEDNPWDRGFQLLLEAMYHHHPVRNNICGTQESIRKITDTLLYDCHRIFYNPSQMVLVVCGDVTSETVLDTVDRTLPKNADPIRVYKNVPYEPPTVYQKRNDARMQVSKPIFFVGFKDPFCPHDPQERLRRDAAMTLLDEILFSRSGAFYSSLFESGILNPSFTCGYSIADGFAFNCISGESDTPEVVIERLCGEVERLKREGIGDEELERARRVLYADEVRAYDSVEEIANRLLSFALEGTELFSYPEMLERITKEEIFSLLDTLFDERYRSVSVIYPLDQR